MVVGMTISTSKKRRRVLGGDVREFQSANGRQREILYRPQ
jgi:hypothetical protein